MNARGNAHLPKMAPDAELRSLRARGLRLYRGESHDGPLPTDAVRDSAGYAWVRNPYA